MAGKRHQGRSHEPRRPRHAARRPTGQRHAGPEDLPLFQELRRAVRSDEPLELLAIVSGIVAVTDPRTHPFERDKPQLQLADLVEPFVGTRYAETTAALTVLASLITDELMVRRIRRELESRKHPMPSWLERFDEAIVEPDVWLMTHVLGDGDDYLFGVTLPSGQPVSALVYVDHNLGTVVKDAFLVPETLEDLVIKLGGFIDGPEQSLQRTDVATARAVVEDAIHHGSLLYPPLESETWPTCRPLVEWILRMLPAGGVAPTPREWTEAETRALADDFFSSEWGATLNRPDESALLDSLLWFGTSYATGDPFRWCIVTVEMLLADWFPRKIVAPPEHLAKLPDLLRAWIQYSHELVGISTSLTRDALVAVERYEPEYQRDIRSARLQGPEALLAGMFDAQTYEDDDRSIAEIMLEGLDRAVGGRYILQTLDDEPLPDEAFEWSGIPEDIQPVVRQVLDDCDRCADELLDVEHRTSMRRFLSRAAAADPAIFRRKASPRRGAAAVAWVICRANGTVGGHRSGLSVQDLLAWFGVSGSVSQRAEPFLRANGVDPRTLYGAMYLGVPDLLTGTSRADITESRDRWIGA